MTDVPSNLIPTRITQLPEYSGSSQEGFLPYVLGGVTYKVQFSNVASAGEVPPSRTLTAGTGLTGGGDLSADRVFAIAVGGVGADQLDTTGVVAGVYGDGSNVPTVTVDANGRVTSVSTSPVVAPGYVPESRTVTAGTGLLGGGSLASNITLSVNLASATPQALGSATVGVSTAAAREDHVHPAVDLSDTNETQGSLPLGRGGTGDALSPVAGAVVYSTGTKFALTNPGAIGQVLTSTGTDEPVWATPTASGGTVTSVNASGGATGMTFTGGPITDAGTLTLGGTLAVGSGGTGATDAATARVNLGAAASGANSDITSLSGITGAISTVDHIQFDVGAVALPNTGQICWNADDGALDVGLFNGSVLQVGQEMVYYAKNTSGATIPDGTPVMFTGAVGASGRLTFGLAVADGSVASEYMMGVTTQEIANNDFGYVTEFGLVRGFDTTGTPYGQTWAQGDLLYFDPTVPGAWTNVQPVAPNISVPVATVINVGPGGSGSIFVRMLLSQRLNRLQDVYINGTGTPLAGQTLIYDATRERWENHTLTAGANVSITNGDGSIAIASSDQFTGTVTSVAASGGTTGLTFTGSPITTSGTLTLGGTLATANGGTGTATYTTGDILYASSTNTLSKLPLGASGTVLTSNGTNVSWQSGGSGGVTSFSGGLTGLTPSVPTTGGIELGGVLAVANGGTGANNPLSAFNTLSPTTSTGDMIYRNSSGNNQRLAIGTSGRYLRSNGSAPSWQFVSISDTTGTVPIFRGGTGTTSSPSDGSLFIGNSGGFYSVSTLTAGANVTITNGPGSITIAASGGAPSGPYITFIQVRDFSFNFYSNSTSPQPSPMVFYDAGTNSAAIWFYQPSYSGSNIGTGLDEIIVDDSGGGTATYVNGTDFSAGSWYAAGDGSGVFGVYSLSVSNSALQTLLANTAAQVATPALAPGSDNTFGTSANIYMGVSGGINSTYSNNPFGQSYPIGVTESFGLYSIYFYSDDFTSDSGLSLDTISVYDQTGANLGTFFNFSDYSVSFAQNSTNGLFQCSISVFNSTLQSVLDNSIIV